MGSRPLAGVPGSHRAWLSLSGVIVAVNEPSLEGGNRWFDSSIPDHYLLAMDFTKRNRRISAALTGKPSPLRGRIMGPNPKIVEAHRRRREKRLIEAPFDELSWTLKRQRVLNEQGGRCLLCNGLPIWKDLPLPFQLDHIDGDRQNNSRPNLRFLCPNCHSQTPTWGSRNASAAGKSRQGFAR